MLVQVLSSISIIIHLIKFYPTFTQTKYGYVASASQDKTVIIWDTLTWTSIQRYTNHTNAVYSLDQIDNDTMASGSKDKTIRIWRISTGQTLKIINVMRFS